jgi:hypothetical protein
MSSAGARSSLLSLCRFYCETPSTEVIQHGYQIIFDAQLFTTGQSGTPAGSMMNRLSALLLGLPGAYCPKAPTFYPANVGAGLTANSFIDAADDSIELGVLLVDLGLF